LTDLSNLKLFATVPHPCSYIDGEQATTLFVDPEANIDAVTYSELSQFGFRRSGKHVYRPRCENCQACIPVRVLVKSFQPSRNQRKCAKRNSDLQISYRKSINNEEHYALYEKYIAQRHADGDMFPASRSQYREFLCSAWNITNYIEFRMPNNQLVAVAVTDILTDGVSAIYTFYDPDEEKRSLGVFSVLYQISLARSLNLPFVYLGYWIQQSDKMRYKSSYKPQQLYIAGQWQIP